MSEHWSGLLRTGFALSTTLCLVLLGLGVYGYQLYVARGERLAALEAAADAGRPTAPTAEAVGEAAGTVVERLRSNEELIGSLRAELAATAAASRAATERAAREQEALRLKLENAERLRLDAEAAVDAARSRITALESELGAGGPVDALVDATGQPLPEVETVSPTDLAVLGMELRLVERERDGARLQLDRALERITALEAALEGAPSGVTADGVGDASRAAQQVAELENANAALSAQVQALETTLVEAERQRASLETAVAAAQAELEAQAAAPDDTAAAASSGP
jgi:hypothetical protein